MALRFGSAMLAGLVVGHAMAAWGTDRPIAVQRFVARVSPAGPESLVLISRDAGLPFPALAGNDAPAGGTVGGASLELLFPDGSDVVLAMPPGTPGAQGWTSHDGTIDQYRFTNPTAPDGFSAVDRAVLKEGVLLRIVASHAGLPATAPIGRLVLRFTTGSLRSCAVLDAASITRDRSGQLVARNAAAPAIADCSNLSLGVPACGNGVRELAEGCDGNDDASCPGQCRPDCTCTPVCGDGVVNQPSEQCDAPSGSASCPEGYFGCRADCSCCSTGFRCDVLGCCDPNALCIPGPSGFGTCYKAYCPPSSPECYGLTCETFETPIGNIDACCEPDIRGNCNILGVGPPCCPGLACDSPIPNTVGSCCVPPGGACTQNTDCCSQVCDGSSVCQ